MAPSPGLSYNLHNSHLKSLYHHIKFFLKKIPKFLKKLLKGKDFKNYRD